MQNGWIHLKCQDAQNMCAVTNGLSDICYIPPASYCKVWCLQHRTTRTATLSSYTISFSVILFNNINAHYVHKILVDCVWNVMAHAQKTDFIFRRNRRVRLNQRGRQFSRLLRAEVCASAVVVLDTPCSKVVWRVLATHSIRQFPLHFPSRASPCAITFQLDSTISW